MPDVIVFDLYGVIARTQTPQAIRRIEARHGALLDRFDALVYSCRIGVAKPDPRAYEICAERLGVEPADVLFFDDTERNIVAAREAGMRAELFTGPDQVRALAG
ncbi:HAD-IA family hydrolase [Actinomadura latina]|uniref:HAD-IA family hydrolase n=1 Tax=Actinomadura latina TaxID=163603 RepID=A0A846Z3T7_9ACTN|nr:HAD-IA family hydrolase [Actinomadura latina]NKZ05882.1 HAD-IA family hydrolase [Actinomadura latina]